MRSTRLLPPQFLCPSWTVQELVQLSQRRGYVGHYRPRRWAEDSIAEDERNDTNLKRKSTTQASAQKSTSQEPKQPTTSLFDELFPEEGHPRRRKQKSRKLDKLPAFDWRAGRRTDQSGEGRSYAATSAAHEVDSLAGLRKDSAFQQARDVLNGSGPAVLLISSLSKSLDESDFTRLSPKAEHIEGWSNGLIKVIQARDTRTLAPLSFYYLLFTSAATAVAYRVNLIRLHSLSKTQSLITKSTMPLPNQPTLKPGEDITSLLKSFTILPSTSRLFIRLLREPFTPFIRKLVEKGNHAAVKEQQGKGDALVLMTLDSGRFSEHDIHEALTRSGRKRNLPWKLAGGERDIERLNGGDLVAEEAAEDLVDEGEDKRTRLRWRASRFVLAMKDRHEARRFVREWHRQPLPSGKHPPLVTVETLW